MDVSIGGLLVRTSAAGTGWGMAPLAHISGEARDITAILQLSSQQFIIYGIGDLDGNSAIPAGVHALAAQGS